MDSKALIATLLFSSAVVAEPATEAGSSSMTAMASTNATVSVKATNTRVEHQWRKVGEGKLSVLFWDIYRAELFNDSGRYQGLQGPLKLSLHYLRTIDREDLLSRTEAEWRKLGLWDGRSQQWLTQAAQVFPSVKKHDRLAFQLNRDDSAQLLFNGQLLHRFGPDEANSRFLAIWLSPNSSFPDFTQRLTGTRL